MNRRIMVPVSEGISYEILQDNNKESSYLETEIELRYCCLDNLIDFIKIKSKEKNKEDYVKTIQIIADYLSENGLDHITAADMVDKFKAGTLANAEAEFMNTIQNVYDKTKREFEFELPQLKRSLNELKESKVN